MKERKAYRWKEVAKPRGLLSVMDSGLVMIVLGWMRERKEK